MKTQISYKTYSGDSNLNLLVERGVISTLCKCSLGLNSNLYSKHETGI